MTAERADVTTSDTRPSGFRIRWGWFIGCVASGFAAIGVGWLVAAPGGRIDYLASVLANVGTTLLLVGIVLLLERRIIDHAVKEFRNAAKESRARMREDFRTEVQDFSKRISAEWSAASPEDIDAMKARTKRLSEELAVNYVYKVARTEDAEGMPER